MHARELVELAALVSHHGAVLVEGPARIDPEHIQQYWAASRCRLERWTRELKRLSQADPQSVFDLEQYADQTRGVLCDVFSGEVLTRVWTAVVVAHDRRRQCDDAQIVVRSVLDAHLEARQRCLRLLVEGPQLPLERAIAINRLRRRSERWCDLLVGNLAMMYDVSHLAVHAERALSLAAELRQLRREATSPQAEALWLTSLRASFRQLTLTATGNEDANARIAGAVVACFDGALFDSTGLLQSLWMTRLATTTADAELLIDELFAEETPAPGTHQHDALRSDMNSPRRRFSS